MIFRYFFALSVTIAIAVFAIPSASCLESTFESAVVAYKQGSFAQSIKLLKSCQQAQGTVGKMPKSDLIHYYLALAFQGQNQKTQACEEYDWILKNSNDATLRTYAVIGAQRLTGAKEAVRANGASTNTTGQAGHAATSSRSIAIRDANSYFMNWHDCGANARDCGPVCLAMILTAYNHFPPNSASRSPHDVIRAVRVLMTGKDSEENTTLEQVVDTAHKVALRTDRSDGIKHVDTALAQGKLVMVCGSPLVKGSFGTRIGYDESAANEGHYMVVTGVTHGEYSVSDPNLHESITISRTELETFLSFYNGRFPGCSIAISP
ncbi:MAG: C39 family peptidase [Candidatus Obscuribacterales bacterium]|nr:C39 family peptidase [Candidatus Obscuribacterales bacterium]